MEIFVLDWILNCFGGLMIYEDDSISWMPVLIMR